MSSGIVEKGVKKKNTRSKEMNVKITKYEVNDNVIDIEFYFDQRFEPYIRPRSSGGKFFYDPLTTYKKNIRKKIETVLKENNIVIDIGEDYQIETKVSVGIIPPKSFSKQKLKMAFLGEIMPNKKPDIDNMVKTLYDTFEGILFFNDSQIIKESFNKSYKPKEYTIINFIIAKQLVPLKGRLNISELELNPEGLTEEEIDYIKNYKKGEYTNG